MFSLGTCIAPVNTMNAGSQGGDLQVCSSSMHPSSVSKEHDVFSSRLLPPNSEKPKATAIAYAWHWEINLWSVEKGKHYHSKICV